MELTQVKLTKSEWEGLEIPVTFQEKSILKLIINGFNNINLKYNNNPSLINFLKISNINDNIMNYLYNEYFKESVDKNISKYNLKFKIENNEKTKEIKKAELIKIKNIKENLSSTFPNVGTGMIIEFKFIELINKILKYKKYHGKKNETKNWILYYFTLCHLSKTSITNINSNIIEYVNFIKNLYKNDYDICDLIRKSNELIERNKSLIDYSDIQLYEHQKKLFSYFQKEEPKIILYCAPTGTGKTLSPLGLSEKYKIIFVCAARHVGLALAKSAISINKKIALAFNCEDPQDIKLHYFAAKDVIRDRNGNIRKVDNTVGDLVEIIICDIKSYLPAMYYMTAFNDKKNIVTYWDEPTITLDYESHEHHEIIQNNWKNNIIPNIVLSSATLPSKDEINDTLNDYRSRFGGEIISINSFDATSKSIPIVNKDCITFLPQFMFSDYNEVKESVKHCEKNPTLLRYLDLQEIVKIISYINDKNLIPENILIKNYFNTIDSITMKSIKNYYLFVLKNIDLEKWNNVYNYYHNNIKSKKYDSNINIVTKDAFTLTDGPTIYLAENTEKIGKFCIQVAKIPAKIMNDINNDINFNSKIMEEVEKLEKDYEDGIASECEKEKKMTDLRISPEMKQLKSKIDLLRNSIKTTNLPDIFIPNRKEHLKKWHLNYDVIKDTFTCDISDSDVITIMKLTDIDPSWKLLLLMGIGVFTNHKSIAYTEIMKKLAENQKLFMIIASSDYIYGTNYQFCHGYIGKDLNKMTQEKTIQAMGRVGRNSIQQNYSIRFRDDDILMKVFKEDKNKIEVINMNKLFNS